MQNGVAAYEFLGDKNVQIGGELERHVDGAVMEEGSLRGSLSGFVKKQGYY